MKSVRLLAFARGLGRASGSHTVLAAIARRAAVLADPVSLRKFKRYWLVIGPFSGLIRVLVLRAAKRRAEAVA